MGEFTGWHRTAMTGEGTPFGEAPKTAKCRVNFTGYDWDDTYTVTSPTGGRKTVKPNGHWSHGDAPAHRRLTEAEEAVLEKIRRDKDGHEREWFKDYEIELTYDEMRLFASAAEKTK